MKFALKKIYEIYEISLYCSLVCLLFINTSIAKERQTIPVTVNFLKKIAVYPRLEAPANVVSLNDSKISSGVNATIVEMPVSVGELVEEDTVLVRLDNTDYHLQRKSFEAKIQQIAAQRALTQWELRQAKKVRSTDKKTLKTLETKLAVYVQQYEDVKVSLERAEHNVEKCLVSAPFEGILVKQFSKVGELASPGKPLVHFIDVSNIEVSADMQSDDVASLRSAKKILFTYKNEKYPLILRTVIPIRDPRTRTQKARLAFIADRALPGTPGRLVWYHSSPHIPPDFLVRRRKTLGVFIHRKGKARFITLINALEGRPAKIEINMNTHIIVQGRHKLNDGDNVNIQ